MNKPNFATMSQKELHDYFLTHRDDREAFYAYDEIAQIKTLTGFDKPIVIT